MFWLLVNFVLLFVDLDFLKHLLFAAADTPCYSIVGVFFYELPVIILIGFPRFVSTFSLAYLSLVSLAAHTLVFSWDMSFPHFLDMPVPDQSLLFMMPFFTFILLTLFGMCCSSDILLFFLTTSISKA